MKRPGRRVVFWGGAYVFRAIARGPGGSPLKVRRMGVWSRPVPFYNKCLAQNNTFPLSLPTGGARSSPGASPE